MARPRKTLRSEDVDRLKGLVDRRATEGEIAQALGMDRTTWRRIRREDARAAEVVSAGRQAEERELVGSLYRQAMGAPAEYDSEGNEIRAEQRPNPSCGMFLLKTRHSYRELGPIEGDVTPSVTINLPAPMTPDQWERMVNVTPRQIEGDDG